MQETEEIQKKDNLIKELQDLISKSRINGRVGQHREQVLMENLIIFIVNRDHKVLEHGIKVGKDQKNVG
jgi:hypothetical protein